MINDARKLDHKTLEAIRIRAVQRVQQGESPEVVIAALGFSRVCIYNWLARYRAGGWGGLKAKRLYGRPTKLKGTHIRWLYEAITMKDPLQFKFPFALWTRSMIAVLIRRRLGLRLSLASVGRLLAQLGLTCQKPLFRAYQQNPTLVEQWKRQEFPRIRALAKKQGAEIYFGDEAGLRSDFHAGTTWAPAGKTPVVRTTGARFSLNMISAISPRGTLRFMVVKGRTTADTFCDFLKRLMHGATKPVFLILDGHPTHRASKVAQYVESFLGRLRLYFLPPYSPELNPDEQVWNHLKNHGIGRMQIHTPKDFSNKVVAHLLGLQKNPQTIRGFFKHPDTTYAAHA